MDHKACFGHGLDNDSNLSDYVGILKELKQKIREKRKKHCQEELMTNIHVHNNLQRSAGDL